MTFAVTIEAAFSAPGAETFTTDIAFELDRGETAVVLGPSGSGKTLLLETIAGFHPFDGSIRLDDRDLTAIPPEKRDFGFVFQDYGLFPHLTVIENVRFGERYHEETGDAEALLADLGVAELADRYPPTLSGGEKQRVALARSLYVRPDVLLLDEPLSSLDVPTKTTLRKDLHDVLEATTAVYVTHDHTTARMLADTVLVLNEGEVVQRGTVEDVFTRPASPFVARFTGSNCIPLSTAAVRTAVGTTGGADWVAVRPEDVTIVDADAADLTATVERVDHEGGIARVTLAVDGTTFDALTLTPPAVGSSVGVTFGASTTLL
ncbi:MAG: ABC transporter ATP-binding protein [Halobacteriales archaeon]|nr:ABC transporter ATP-binding protein [Halobacteriales archaeon]